MPEEQATHTPLIPTFIQNPVEYGPTWTNPVNPTWWASAATASALGKRYGGKPVQMPPYYPAHSWRETFKPAFQWYLKFPTGTLINAGTLADFFVHDPESTAPGVADRYVRETIEAAESGN